MRKENLPVRAYREHPAYRMQYAYRCNDCGLEVKGYLQKRVFGTILCGECRKIRQKAISDFGPPKWVPVDDASRNPKNGEFVLGSTVEGKVWMYRFQLFDDVVGGFYRVGVNSKTLREWDEGVLAWMPLPKSYLGGIE